MFHITQTHFRFCFFGFVLLKHGKTVPSFTSVFYPVKYVCHFGDELQIEQRKQCLAVPLSIQCISWEETKCISQSGGNVTVLVIRAFKLAALPKHCQTLCERSEILTALSPLIVGSWEKKNAKTDLHDIDSEKHSSSHNIVDRFFVFLHPPLWLPWCHFYYFFFPLSILPYFISFNAHPLLPLPPILSCRYGCWNLWVDWNK